jgi:HEAT repeat protein
MWRKTDRIKRSWRKASQRDPFFYSNNELLKKVVNKTFHANAKTRFQIVDFLIEELRQSSANVRYHAAWALGRIGEKLAVKPLIVALGDENKSVRERAAYSLGQLGDSEAIEPLIWVICNDPNSTVRLMAEGSLEKFDTETIHKFVNLFGDKTSSELNETNLNILLHNNNFHIRFLTIKALGNLSQDKMQWNRLFEQLIGDSDWFVQQHLTKILIQVGEPALPQLFESLKHQNVQVRINTAIILGKMGNSQAIAPLLQAFQVEKEKARTYILEALEKLGEKEVVKQAGNLKDNSFELLLAALNDENHRTRQRAATELGNMADPRAVGPLVKAMLEEGYKSGSNYEENKVCRRISEALIKIGDLSAEELLFEALKADYWDSQAYAAETLGELGDKRAIEPLKEALEKARQEKDGMLQRYIEVALNKLEG